MEPKQNRKGEVISFPSNVVTIFSATPAGIVPASRIRCPLSGSGYSAASTVAKGSRVPLPESGVWGSLSTN